MEFTSDTNIARPGKENANKDQINSFQSFNKKRF